MKVSTDLDRTDWLILEALQEDARLSYRELAEMVSLSAPAVASRVKGLEDAGVIDGYHASVNPGKLGLGISAYVRISRDRHGAKNQNQFDEVCEQIPWITENHHVVGEDCDVLRIFAPNLEALETVLDRLGAFGRTTTSLVLSTAMNRAVLRSSVLEKDLDSSSDHPS